MWPDFVYNYYNPNTGQYPGVTSDQNQGQAPATRSLLDMLSPSIGNAWFNPQAWGRLLNSPSPWAGQATGRQPYPGAGALRGPVSDPNDPLYDPRYDPRRRQMQQFGNYGLNLLQGGGYGNVAPTMDNSWLRGGR